MASFGLDRSLWFDADTVEERAHNVRTNGYGGYACHGVGSLGALPHLRAVSFFDTVFLLWPLR